MTLILAILRRELALQYLGHRVIPVRTFIIHAIGIILLLLKVAETELLDSEWTIVHPKLRLRIQRQLEFPSIEVRILATHLLNLGVVDNAFAKVLLISL